MKTKQWWKSRTIWANVAALGFLLVFAGFGMIMPVQWQASLLTALNVGLRLITTIKLGKEEEESTDSEEESSSSTLNEKKPWWKSKTIWINLIALVSFTLAEAAGFKIPVQAEAALLSIVNIIMRTITGSGLTLRKT